MLQQKSNLVSSGQESRIPSSTSKAPDEIEDIIKNKRRESDRSQKVITSEFHPQMPLPGMASLSHLDSGRRDAIM